MSRPGKVTLLTRTGLDWTDRFGKRDLGGAGRPRRRVGGHRRRDRRAAEQRRFILRGAAAGAVGRQDRPHDPLRLRPAVARRRRISRASRWSSARRSCAICWRAADEHGALRFSEHFSEPGKVMLEHACRMGLEGVISKRADAPYRSGRGHDWVKSKCTLRQEFVIAGYLPSQASGPRHPLAGARLPRRATASCARSAMSAPAFPARSWPTQPQARGAEGRCLALLGRRGEGRRASSG